MGFVRRAESVSTTFDDSTPTPTTIRQKVSMLDEPRDHMRYSHFSKLVHADKQAHFGKQHWNEPVAWANPRYQTSAPNRPFGTDASTDGSLAFGQDLEAFGSGELDFDHYKDENILAMLDTMARGSPEDDELSDVVSLLPIEVQEEDPVVAHLVAECGAMWEEVYIQAEVRRELRSRLEREIRQLQERWERGYHQSAAFMQRLATAKEALSEKLYESSLINEELKKRLEHEWRNNERFKCSMTEGIKNLTAQTAEINAHIWEVSDHQATLVEQLHSATALQAQLQEELQEERHRTWRQSTDVVMAFARGERGTASSGVPPPLISTPSFSSAPSRAVGDHQARNDAVLTRELTKEDQLRSELQVQVKQIVKRAAACGFKFHADVLDQRPVSNIDRHLQEYVDAPEVSVEDLLDQLRDIEDLQSQLASKEAELAAAASDHMKAQQDLQAEKDELTSIQRQLVDAESAQEGNHAKDMAEAEEAIERLEESLREQQVALKEEEASISRRHDLFRSQVDQKRKELTKLAETNERLEEAILRRTSGCLAPAQRPPRRSYPGSSASPDYHMDRGRPPPGYQGRPPPHSRPPHDRGGYDRSGY